MTNPISDGIITPETLSQFEQESGFTIPIAQAQALIEFVIEDGELERRQSARSNFIDTINNVWGYLEDITIQAQAIGTAQEIAFAVSAANALGAIIGKEEIQIG
jgi:hypothetical protein